MNPIDNKPAVLVASASEVMEMEAIEEQELRAIEDSMDEETLLSSMATHIMDVFQENKDARTSSGIEQKLLQSLRAYNGHYDPEDIRRIEESGGSDIYMNLTPTKCRAAMSWIRDILLAAKEQAWSLEPTPIPELPAAIKEKVGEHINSIAKPPEPPPQQQPQEGQEGGQAQPPKSAAAATQELQEANQLRLDVEEAILNEIYKIARAEVKKFEVVVSDQLAEGDWNTALSEFIEDFCVFQVAIMKGPIITKKKRLSWVDGMPKVKEDFIFLNKRVSPLDIYPSASATKIDDGNLCEHIRLSRGDLYNLIGVPEYKEENIRELLETGDTSNMYTWLDTYIEDEKVTEEYRGDTYRANKGVFHGVHYFGSASYSMLVDWGLTNETLGFDEEKEFQIEAILVGNKVIKCVINDDPLLRRPYYKASFQNIPGSWWGRSLPELMRDIQRMCNATARALSNNMGVAAGPQVEVYIDRVAADEEIEDIYPLKIWQVTSDPSGAGGRAVNFWQPSSNAGELLTVYKEFELRADDATGIPRYAYGNERTGGAAQTASGLSMLLESASKGIKDAVRHIDDGLIKPRVEYQFYWNLLTDDDVHFNGDIVVVPHGSEALTMKGAQEMRRNEFLQIIGNPAFMEIVGMEGIAEILREMAKSLGLGTDIIPSRMELKKRQEQAKAAAAEQQQAEQQAASEHEATGVKQVEMQVSQAEQASQRNAELKMLEIQQEAENDQRKNQLKAQELEQRREETVSKATAALTKQQMQDAQRDRDTNKNIALSIQSGYEDKNNSQ